MKHYNLIAQLENMQSTFSKTEQLLKEFVLANLKDIENISIVSLSEMTGASKSTISRFCRKLGYENFREFSGAIVQQVAINYSLIHEGVNAEDSTMGIASKVFNEECKALENTLGLLDPLQLDELVETLLERRKIYLYAVGGSSAIAVDLVNKFTRLGIECIYYPDLVFQKLSARTKARPDITWLISFSGYDTDMLEIAEHAKAAGSTIVSMTNNQDSPLAVAADYALTGSRLDIYAYTGTTESRLSLLYLADILFTLIAVSGSPDATRSLTTTKDLLMKRLDYH